MMIRDAKPGDSVILGREETEIVDGRLIVREVGARQVVYTRESIAAARAMLDKAEAILDEAEHVSRPRRILDRVRGLAR